MKAILRASGLAILTFTLGHGGVRAADAADDGASQMKKHTEAMSKGMNHDEARKASLGTSDDANANSELQHKHAAAMAKGAGHDEARKMAAAAPSKAETERVNARARKHKDAMSKGASHDEARKEAGGM